MFPEARPLPPALFSPLNAIIDADVAARAGLSVPALARAFLAGGARFLQLRAKQASGRDLLAWADEIAAEARRHDALLVINDRVDVALMAGVRAVHVGQDDVPVDKARGLLGPEAIVGLSTHTPAQIDEALRQPISYLAVGPIFGTRTKETGYDAVGLDLVRHAAGRVRDLRGGSIPIVAIGGITLATAPAVIAAGASSVAVISDLVVTGDPAARAAEYLRSLGAHVPGV